MIQEIAPHQYDLTYRQPEPKDDDYVLYIKSSKTLLRKCEDGNYEIPCFSDFPMEKPRLKMTAGAIIMCGKCCRRRETDMNSAPPPFTGR